VAFEHQTVLLDEAVSLLNPGVGRVIVDGTLGGGGHSEALLAKGAEVYGFDRDPQALAAAGARLARFGERFHPVKADFGELGERLDRRVDGVLLDLGVSSPQLDQPERGFSFQTEGPLDMRMGDEGPTAAELIEATPQEELTRIIRDYGDERFAGRIARSLKEAKPRTTQEAVEVVKRSVPRAAWPKKTHLATKTFQALRMAVNHELESLDRALAALPEVLELGGVAAVITFHSLEDRAVKRAFRSLEGRCTCPPGLPVCGCGARGTFESLTRKPITASEEETIRNPRARSAHLRAVQRAR
jgi:16S rRNA (cytosine1402-N4)-methyltransferase